MKSKKLTKTEIALEILKQTRMLTEDINVIGKLQLSDESLKNFYRNQVEGLIDDFRFVAYRLLKLKIKKK